MMASTESDPSTLLFDIGKTILKVLVMSHHGVVRDVRTTEAGVPNESCPNPDRKANPNSRTHFHRPLIAAQHTGVGASSRSNPSVFNSAQRSFGIGC